MLKLTLPWPPTVNTYYRNVGGVMKISEAGRKYRKAVADEVLVSRAAKLLPGRLEVLIFAYPPDKRTRDLDNITKSLLDSLTKAGVWVDDEQIDSLWIRRGDASKPGSVKVQVEELE